MTTIRLVEPPGDDHDGRREVKYAFERADLFGLRRHLLDAGRRIRFSEDDVSVVRSIYFDDNRLSTATANVDGIGRRRKVRLRWYDRAEPGEQFFFEIKWRRNRLTGKARRHLLADAPLSGLTFEEMKTALLEVLDEPLRELLCWYPEPTVLVEYRREHFELPDIRARVTLDYDLKFYDQSGRVRPATTFGLPRPEFVVMEVKTKKNAAPGLHGVLRPFSPRATRSSKYVDGCTQLGLLTG